MFKSANVGTIDRVVRIIVGAFLIVAPYLITSELWANSLARWGIPLVGAVFVLTAVVRFCPLYRLIGASTYKAS